MPQVRRALAEAPSLAMDELVAPQRAIYRGIAREAFTGIPRINPAVIEKYGRIGRQRRSGYNL
jgi:hypothetical protein